MLSSHVEEVAAWKSASNVNGSMSEARFILSVLTPQVLVSHSQRLQPLNTADIFGSSFYVLKSLAFLLPFDKI